MNQPVLPFFKSHYSIGKSILTLELPDEKKKDPSKKSLAHPDSIFEILQENNMDKFFLIDDNVSGFLQANVNSKKLKKRLMFGLRVCALDNALVKDEASKQRESKIVIFCKNKKGYQELIKLWSEASQQGFYYYPRVDDLMLSKLDTTNLFLVIPFYDSYIYRNTLECRSCTPSFIQFFKNVHFSIEENELPFDQDLKSLVEKSARDFQLPVIKAKSIYYKNREDFLSYLTFRCMDKRATLSKPNLEHMCSEEFCFESWKEKNNGVRF